MLVAVLKEMGRPRPSRAPDDFVGDVVDAVGEGDCRRRMLGGTGKRTGIGKVAVGDGVADVGYVFC